MDGRLHASPEPSLSETATSAAHGEDSPYFAGWRAYDEDPYHPITNPSGVIQMGLAENQVCCQILVHFMMRAGSCMCLRELIC
jgi:1-aminocyclopropane-1-carboxylate synthase